MLSNTVLDENFKKIHRPDWGLFSRFSESKQGRDIVALVVVQSFSIQFKSRYHLQRNWRQAFAFLTRADAKDWE